MFAKKLPSFEVHWLAVGMLLNNIEISNFSGFMYIFVSDWNGNKKKAEINEEKHAWNYWSVFIAQYIFWHMIVRAINYLKNQLNEWSTTHIPLEWQAAIHQRQWKEHFFFYLGKITFCPNELPNGELMDNRGKSFEFDEYQKNYWLDL